VRSHVGRRDRSLRRRRGDNASSCAAIRVNLTVP
jgi:hypothetical protein